MQTAEKQNMYSLVSRRPIAKFYYKGHHTHPVRRTVAIIKQTRNYIQGYELREGTTIRSLEEARQTIKTYSRKKIARYGDYKRLRKSSQNFFRDPTESTLERFPIVSLFTDGV